MQTSVFLPVSALAAAALALSGCHHRAAPAGATAMTPGMVVSQARLLLPAVKGHPAAAYFTLGNENNLAATLVRVDVDGVKQTEMHETVGGAMTALSQVRIDPGKNVIFSPAGKHVMAFGIAPSLTPGGASAIIFHFQDGKTTSAPLRVEALGDGMGSGMVGMGAKP